MILRARRRGGHGNLLLLLLVILQVGVDYGLANTDDGGPNVSLDTVWAASDTITVTLTTTNLTQHKVVVSVRHENNSSVTVFDHLPPSPQHHNNQQHHQHTVGDLSSDTRYQVCVSATLDGDHMVEGDCYMIHTLPHADNITGSYAAALAVGMFLAVVVMSWVLYKTIWSRWMTKMLPNNDKYDLNHPSPDQQPSTNTPPQPVNV